jgi:hypothetical protein
MTENEKFFKNINNDAQKTNISKKKYITYRFNPKDYSLNVFDENVFNPKDFNYFPEEYSKEFNNYGYRSDNFVKEHKDFHILFSGCSQTFGFALNLDEMWSKILYDKISKNKKCDGYFNLSVSGTGIQFIISNLFKYFKNFGNPDCIFLNLSDNFRFISFLPEINGYGKITFDTKDSDIQKFLCLINYNYYLMLEQYCKTNKIQLYSVSWDTEAPKHYNTNEFFSNFKTFIPIDSKKMHEDIINDENKYKSNYYYYARDGVHDGAGYNIWLANFLYDKYLKDNT